MGVPSRIDLKKDFLDLTEVYIQTFPRSYLMFGAPHGALTNELGGHLRLYAECIKSNHKQIYEAAAEAISEYLYQYNVYTEESVDEYKIIYFLGRAIERYLPDFKALKGAHLCTMVGLLDFRLRTLGIEKNRLFQVLLKLIREGKLDAELGPTGCYLLYKCVSTTERKPVLIAVPEVQMKGTGVDRPARSVASKILDE